ncbi:unnamed protein product, partial [Ixodes pacificus]
PQPYSFGFDNIDEFGTRMTRQETGDEFNNKVGSYSYVDALGVSRVVKYVADATGFHPTVETNEPGTKTSAPADAPFFSSAIEGPHPVVVKAAPVAVHAVHASPVVHPAAPFAYAHHAPLAYDGILTLQFLRYRRAPTGRRIGRAFVDWLGCGLACGYSYATWAGVERIQVEAFPRLLVNVGRAGGATAREAARSICSRWNVDMTFPAVTSCPNFFSFRDVTSANKISALTESLPRRRTAASFEAPVNVQRYAETQRSIKMRIKVPISEHYTYRPLTYQISSKQNKLLFFCIAAMKPKHLPQPYSFGFDNVDEFGTRMTRQETGDEFNNKVGSYSYVDALGVSRVVKYVADATGFHPTVETNEPGTKTSAPADAPFFSTAVEGPHPVVVRAGPVAVHAVRAAPVVHAAAPFAYAHHAPLAYGLAKHL